MLLPRFPLSGPEPHIVNCPELRGGRACKPTSFGDFGRYAVFAIHTRGDAVEWFVEDAEQADPKFPSRPAIIRQAPTRDEAVSGLVSH